MQKLTIHFSSDNKFYSDEIKLQVISISRMKIWSCEYQYGIKEFATSSSFSLSFLLLTSVCERMDSWIYQCNGLSNECIETDETINETKQKCKNLKRKRTPWRVIKNGIYFYIYKKKWFKTTTTSSETENGVMKSNYTSCSFVSSFFVSSIFIFEETSN